MNKVIAEFSSKQESILHGDHHIITSVRLKDGLEAVPGGCLLYEDGGIYAPLKSTDTSKSPTAVTLEEVAGKTYASVANVAVHGAVRMDRLCYADGTPVASTAAAKLRAAGIYAIGEIPPSASAPTIVAQPQGVEVMVGGDAKAFVVASAPDGGKLSYKWFKSATESTSAGSAVQGATSPEFTADTSAAGTSYYYCEVTNTLNNTTASVKTDAIAVKVTAE